MTHFYSTKPIERLTTSFCFLVFLLFNHWNINAQITDTYTASGSWTVPAGVTSLTVAAWGGGGGGGGSTGNKNGGSGGGGGGYTTAIIAVTAGQVIPFTVGAGGIAAVGANGGNGGNTTILTLAANGGIGGAKDKGTAGAGGTATGGTTNTTGTAGSTGTTTGGAGGAGANGGVGGTGGAANGPGLAGSIIGGGGSGSEYDAGSSTSYPGGNGARGEIRITYIQPAPANNDCAGAIALTVNPTLTCTTSTNGTTVSATQSVAGCVGTADDDVWYKFVATSTSHIVTVVPTSLSDIVFQVYSTSCAGSSILCHDGGSGSSTESMTLNSLTIGTTYYVRVYSYSSGTNQGTFNICVTTLPACTTPTAQATSLVLTQPVNGTISGTFTAASPVPSNYLIIYNTTNTVPAPVNGTSYSIGGTVGAGNIVADNDGTTAFSVTGLSSATTYYFFVFSFNSISCSGGPLYYTTSPLTNNATTPFFYCTPAPTSVDGTGITNFTMGTINNTTGSEAGNYGNYSAQSATGTQLQTMNFNITLTTGFTYGTIIWVDWNNDGDFIDAGETAYTGLSTSTSPTTLSGNFLIPSTATIGNHRLRIGAADTDSGPSSACYTGSYASFEDYTLTVTAASCAGIPTAVAVSAVTLTTATVNWTASSPVPANGYQYYVTTSATLPTAGTTPTGTTASGVTTVNLTGLTANSTYYVYVRNDCGGGNYSSWTAQVVFLTGYCTATSTGTTYYINDFSTTGGTANITNNASGFSATGYGNFTASAVSQQQYGTVNFSSVFTGGTFGCNIWIDWNDDLDFNDAGEKVYASASYVSTATGTITVPGTAAVGNHRMRVRINYSATDPSACGSISSGETEDYTFTVLASACSGIPTAVVMSAVATTTATVSWTASAPAPASGYQYYLTTSSTVPTAGTAATGSTAAGVTTVNLTGLIADTTYYIYVRNNCGAGNYSPWTTQVVFVTGYCVANNSTNTTYYISGVTTTGGSANFSNTGTGFSAGGYINYSATYSVSQNAGLGFTITATHPSSTYGYSVWVDWNNDNDFADAGENVIITNYLSSPAAVGTVTIPAGTPAGNYRMRIRNAYLSNPAPACGDQAYGETEDYKIICLGPLPCAGNPTVLSVNVTSQTTATVNWTAASPVPANGYQYYYATALTAPVAGTTPTGSTAAGVTTLNLTGLTSATTYYIWVRSNCGGGLGQGAWVGPVNFYMPNCTVGSSIGTTSLACPSVISGGLGLLGADPAPIDCSSSSSCVDLEANYLQIGQTTDYTVEAIAYNPPYQFGCLQNPVSVHSDDVWSPVINLPFNFCFYGNTYNSCLIGSNGVLSFNTGSAGSGTGYSFSNSLPSTTGALFANTIYGVYHDIDPSKGGEVGWELITLNTGCRALVASWKDVPMFSDNSILYTGMMVLYENTNIIEVYIKNKSIDNNDVSPWNGGNAIVGVQNAAGTQAVVAPGRNGLDTNWTVTNEAWRFVPAGASITSLKWYEGAGTTGPVVGTTDTINVCPPTTTIYTAEVTYTLCNGTTLKETEQTTVTVSKSKTWNGSVSTDWNTDANWTPVGVPTNMDCVLIPVTANNPIVSNTAIAAYGRTLTILNSATLTLNSATTLTITDLVTVNTGGQFIIENNASLIQVNNVTNIGNITMKRNTQPMYLYDYTYWGSPVSNFTLGTLSPASSYRFTWTPSVGGASGNWILESAATVMTPGKGYIVRAPDTYSTNPAVKTSYIANFTGVPNNGDITTPITFGSMGPAATNDKWNLLGNPYPSAVSAATFLNNATNSTLLDGTIYFWTHNTPPAAAFPDPFYGDFIINYTDTDYASWNKTGGVGTIASTGGPAPNGFIAAGQSFFVRSLAVAGSAVFNNGMRSSTYVNSQFFRQAEATTALVNQETPIERHRIWLNFTNNSGAFSQILVGYIQGATQGWDRGFDGTRFSGNDLTFYSIIPNESLAIQGRALPFQEEDQVLLGFNSQNSGTFSIKIDHFDGLFEDQDVFIEDKLLGITHNLKQAPYVFTTQGGIFDNRFVLKYKESTLGTDEFALDNTVQVISNQKVTVYSSQQEIKNIVVYDVLGRKIDEYKNVGGNQFPLKNLNPTTNALILKITLANGITITEKIIY